MTLLNMLLLFVTAFIGGALNSVAGGGSFFTLPALIFVGVPPIQANATSTVAIWPGSVASVGAYRRELRKQSRSFLLLMLTICLIGGILGAFLLLNTSQDAFIHLLPYLLLVATLLFVISPYITAKMRARANNNKGQSRGKVIGIAIFQLIIATYGGYFGGGIGILMLAGLGLMGMDNIHEMNALKTVFASCINGVAVVIFILFGKVVWFEAILMIIAAIIGGYGGAYYARKLKPQWVRTFVIVVGVAMTIYFFTKTYV